MIILITVLASLLFGFCSYRIGVNRRNVQIYRALRKLVKNGATQEYLNAIRDIMDAIE